MGTLSGFSERDKVPRSVVGRLDLRDPPRDEDVIESRREHQCSVLTPDLWCCDNCGDVFDRDPNLGDFPESAIIEGECKPT